jgi:hypothetical protein
MDYIQRNTVTPPQLSPTTASIKRKLSTDITLTKLTDKNNGSPEKSNKKIRRIQPIKISEVVSLSVIPITNKNSHNLKNHEEINSAFGRFQDDVEDEDLLCELENSHNKGKRGRKKKTVQPLPTVIDNNVFLNPSVPRIHESSEHFMLIHEQAVNHQQPPSNSVIVNNNNNNNNNINDNKVITENSSTSSSIVINMEKTPINNTFAELLKVCREADPSSDMSKLIDKKLMKYYETVHPDFVNSKSFIKNVNAVISDIRTAPNLVYLKLANILEELNIRRKSRNTVMSNEDVTTTGDVKKDNQIKKLNRALYFLKRRIAKLEEAEVDFDNEDYSTYVQVEKYKKRACEVSFFYEISIFTVDFNLSIF